ncbi:F-box domain containing protein [Tanacetum coccineum]
MSKMAHDILSGPVSTVDTESVFDTSMKEMDRYRCTLRPETVEALYCAKDWLRTVAAPVVAAVAAAVSSVAADTQPSVPLYYPSWEKVPKERKAVIISDIGAAHGFLPLDRDLRRHQHALAKSLQYQQGFFQGQHKGIPTTGLTMWKAIRRARPEDITTAEWDKQASDTQEYPSLVDTFWRTHTADGVFPKDEDRRIYEEMKRLEATGGYTEDEINRLARGGKLRGHIPGVGRVLPARATSRPSMPAPDKSLKSIHKKVNFMMSLFRSDSKYSDMFKEFESGGASGSGGSGGCGDDEESGDDEEGEDEEGED